MNDSPKTGMGCTILGLTGLIGSALFYYDASISNKIKEERVSFAEGNFDYEINFRCRGRETIGLNFFPCKQLKNISQVSIGTQYNFGEIYPKEEIPDYLRAQLDCMGNICFSLDENMKKKVWGLYSDNNQN